MIIYIYKTLVTPEFFNKLSSWYLIGFRQVNQINQISESNGFCDKSCWKYQFKMLLNMLAILSKYFFSFKIWAKPNWNFLIKLKHFSKLFTLYNKWLSSIRSAKKYPWDKCLLRVNNKDSRITFMDQK